MKTSYPGKQLDGTRHPDRSSPFLLRRKSAIHNDEETYAPGRMQNQPTKTVNKPILVGYGKDLRDPCRQQKKSGPHPKIATPARQFDESKRCLDAYRPQGPG